MGPTPETAGLSIAVMKITERNAQKCREAFERAVLSSEAAPLDIQNSPVGNQN
jgi:hypothetical protein